MPTDSLRSKSVSEENFRTDVLDNFRNDDLGKVCKSDKTLYKIEIDMYDPLCDKPTESKKKVYEINEKACIFKNQY